MTDQQSRQDEIERKNRRVLFGALLCVFLMIGLAFGSVPLYDLFCRVTGFGGTTGTAEVLPEKTLDRVVTVQFNANTARDMPWQFKPEQREIQVKLGQGGLTAYRAENTTSTPVTGTAIYNVTPLKAGKYFKKIQCFCFGEQTLAAGEAVDMPVYFFVDPALADDPMMDDVKTINLSYTFFRAETPELDQALEDYYSNTN